MTKVKKTFILKISKQDGGIVMIPFSNKTDASRQQKKELKDKDNRMVMLTEI